MQLESECQQKEDALAKVEKLNHMLSELELQLEVKCLEKEEASAKVNILDTRVSELELMLQTDVQHEAVEKILEMGQQVAELELQLHTQAQQKLEATEKVEMLVSRVADLERQLEEQSHTMTELDQQVTSALSSGHLEADLPESHTVVTVWFLSTHFPEKQRECGNHPAVQSSGYREGTVLCPSCRGELTCPMPEFVVCLQDLVAAERDHLEQELGMFVEQNEKLEKELGEKREVEEFECLEEEFRKEHVVRSFHSHSDAIHLKIVFQNCCLYYVKPLFIE